VKCFNKTAHLLSIWQSLDEPKSSKAKCQCPQFSLLSIGVPSPPLCVKSVSHDHSQFSQNQNGVRLITS